MKRERKNDDLKMRKLELTSREDEDGFKQKNWSQKYNKRGNIGSYKRNKLDLKLEK